MYKKTEGSKKKKTYEAKFCFMQKEMCYIRLKKRLPIKSLKIALPPPPPTLFQKIFVKTKNFL